ncbi:efflux RND transporter periplasmic adaptor subunit [Planctellipticum variicoloris]|uniref:efflux RND transporter periplasmic adaptor subunit n=1 Tax=Planctellipticum variicoloris TaxID=3064265 RepID=UPI0030131F7A|nr:efflux RND transporter periplasmic adaptor subunit [Planctomycetaceae bacterium SH412]
MLLLQPVLVLAAGTLLFVGLGLAQRKGWISGGHGAKTAPGNGAVDHNVQYICPMMCTPPQAEPGRCPVCGMELVPSSHSQHGELRSVHIDPAARRIANIQTVAARSLSVTRSIRAIGELRYDEGTLKTISAYVDGRLDRLFADYTGIVVKEGDHLALLYSPQLYSGQVELLLARKARERSQALSTTKTLSSGPDLYASARERLKLLGMTDMQIGHLEERGAADSRLELCAPISGTVIEKLAVEGQYVKEGDPICKLADLSSVWLMLRLFPEDATAIRYGQKVEAEVQSLPGRKFSGRVAFVDPQVDPKTRTVGVRVVIPNEKGMLRVGDYARATIEVPFGTQEESLVYDPELADKWISPRHPQVMSSTPGQCSVCGVELVPAASLGFIGEPIAGSQAIVIPRDAVLMAGSHSVVYVETEPGRFEIRRVVLGPTTGDQIVIRSGIGEGERVATRGNFLIDSQMQLAGNPSLIDPTRAEPKREELLTPEMLAVLDKLATNDRRLAVEQQICPVTNLRLGSMGVPPRVIADGKTVFLCCPACEGKFKAAPDKYQAVLANRKTSAGPPPSFEDPLAGLSAEDRRLAKRQEVCPVADLKLGTMGQPVRLSVDGKPVFLCCEACRKSLLSEPDKYLKKLAARNSSEAKPSAEGEAAAGAPSLDDLEMFEIEEISPPESQKPKSRPGRGETR